MTVYSNLDQSSLTDVPNYKMYPSVIGPSSWNTALLYMPSVEDNADHYLPYYDVYQNTQTDPFLDYTSVLQQSYDEEEV